MASSMAVPRASSHTTGKLRGNFPVIEHPMAKLGNKSELSIRGSSSLSIRRENTVVTVSHGRVELGLQGAPVPVVRHEINDEPPNPHPPSYVVSRKSTPDRILQWPPDIDYKPPFRYTDSLAEREGLLDQDYNDAKRRKRRHEKEKGIILPPITKLVVTGVGGKTKKEPKQKLKFPSLDSFLEVIEEETDDGEYIQGPRRSVPRKTDVSLQYVSRSPLELSDMIKEKLTSGYYGLRHLFKANDPSGQGNVSREALMRILLSLCGYISPEQYTRFLKKYNLDKRESISFDNFVSCFKENETYTKVQNPNSKSKTDKLRYTIKGDMNLQYLEARSGVPELTVKKEWVSPVQRLAVEETFPVHKPEESLRRSDVVYHDPYTSAPFADKLFRERIRTLDDIKKVLPPSCFLPEGMVVPPQLREAFAQLSIYVTDAEFSTLWQRYDTEGLGAVYTSKLLRKMGIDTLRRPKTFHANELDDGSKVIIHRRPFSQTIETENKNSVTVKNETNDSKTTEVKINHERVHANGASKTEVTTVQKESHSTSNSAKVQNSQQVKVQTEIPQETSFGYDPAKTKVLKAAIKKQAPKLENIIDCMHYRFEESYNALSTAFHLFDQLDDGYIARLDFRRVLQEFGLNTSVTDLDYFLSRIGLRSIRGQINYREFLNKFQSKAESSITTRIVTNQQHLFQHDALPIQKPTLNAEEMESGVVNLLHGDFLKLISYFRSCDKYCLGVITPHEFRSGIEKRLGYPMSERQWQQLKSDVGVDKDGLIPYPKFLQLFDVTTKIVSPGAWNKRQEGNIEVTQISPGDMPHPSAVDRLRDKVKDYMTPRDIPVPRIDDTRTVAEIQKLLEELFKNRMHTFDKVEEVNDLKNGLRSTITKCIPNLTISGFIGDVHLVSHGKVFNEALTCPLPQVTRRPLALQHDQYCKHFKEMDRKMMGRMSKWQFGALLKLCGLVLTTGELDKIWATLNVGADGMYSYSALIRHFIQFKVPPGFDEKRTMNFGSGTPKSITSNNPGQQDTKELVEAAKQVQRERKEQKVKTEMEKTTTQITQTVEVEHTNVREKRQEKTVTVQEQKPVQVTNNTVQPSYISSKPPSTTKDLLVKCKQDVIGNWDGLKSVFKYIDKSGLATVTYDEMMSVMTSMNFKLTDEEKRELCHKFDLQKNGRFHYLEFMKCYSQRQENVSKSKNSLAYNKYSHKLEHKRPDKIRQREELLLRLLMMEHKNLRRAFKKLDVYNKGYLGVGDFKKALTTCKITVTNEDFYHMLTEFDQTMTGKISYQDFLTTLLSV